MNHKRDRQKIVCSTLLAIIVASAILGVLVSQASATTIFSDGWETAQNFTTNWTGSSGDASVVTDDKHTGTYSARFFNTTEQYCYKTFAAQTTVYASFWIRFATPPPNAWDTAFFMKFKTGDIDLSRIYLDNTGGGWRWRVMGIDNGVFIESTSSFSSINTSQWYHLVFKNIVHATAGEYRLYVDDTEVIAMTGKDTENAGGVTTANFGVGWAGTPITDYVDDVSIDDTYTGPQVPEINVGVSGTTTMVYSTLCKFYASWTTSFSNLSKYVFGTNNTGSWVNESATSFPADVMSGWSNITKTLTSEIGARVEWEIWANNTSGNWTNTGLKYFTVTISYTANLLYSTSFESTTIYSSGSIEGQLNLEGLGQASPRNQLQLNTGTFWVQGLTSPIANPPSPHTGSKCIGLNVPAGTGMGIRSELQMNRLDGSDSNSLPPIMDEAFFSVWLYLPSDWNLQATGYNWYELADPFWLWVGSWNGPRTCLHIHKPNGPNGPFDLQLEYEPYQGGPKQILGTVSNFVVPKGEWFNLKYWIFKSNAEGEIKLWLSTSHYGENYLVADGTNLQTIYYGQTNWFSTIGKVYLDGDGYSHSVWIDDLEIWDGMPTGNDYVPPTYDNVAHSTTIAGQTATFSCLAHDPGGLAGGIFSWNGTGGVWGNETYVALAGTVEWLNQSKTLPTAGTKVGYRWYFEDTAGNWVATSIFSFQTTSVGENIVVLLNLPTNLETKKARVVTFSYTVVFYQAIKNCSLWVNVAGTWQKVASNSSTVVNATQNSMNYEFSTSGTYLWNIGGYNSTTVVFAQSNRTLIMALEPWSGMIGYDSIIKNTPCMFSVQLADGDGLSGFILGSTVSGTFQNETWEALTGQPTGVNAYAVTTLPNSIKSNITFIFYFNDTDDFWGASIALTFYTSIFSSQSVYDYNAALIADGSPFISDGTHEITALTYSAGDPATLSFTVYAPSGISTTELSCASKGKPQDVLNASSWSHDLITNTLSVNATHSSSVSITVTWAGGAAAGPGQSKVGSANLGELFRRFQVPIVIVGFLTMVVLLRPKSRRRR